MLLNLIFDGPTRISKCTWGFREFPELPIAPNSMPQVIESFIENASRSVVVNIGDSKSIITHPASTTHQQLSAKELEEAGVPGGLIRLSVGLEDTQDLIDDLAKALG